MRRTTLTLTEPQVRQLLAAIRLRAEEFSSDLDDLEPNENAEARSWYEKQLAELRPLERRLNAAGLRVTA